MTNNEVLRSIRYLLNVSDAKLVEILELAGCEVELSDITAALRREDEPGYVELPDEVMAYFLNGLVLHKRGKDPARPPQPLDLPITNNVVLKKLRVAFQLKDTDVIRLIEKQGTLKISKAELGAFFRAPDHRNYRECGDQYLRNLLKGLS
jgi:uncharacterized protein YehS (DUF1456 family)